MKKDWLIGILWWLFSSIGQAMPTDTLPFPAAWVGNWAGTLEIFNAAQGKVNSVPMQLRIHPKDSVYTWQLLYGNDQQDQRPYELHTLDAAKGLYLMDEKNSIRMEAYYMGSRLFCWFEVQGTRLLTTEYLEGDALIFEIVVSATTPISTTGNEVVSSDTIPEVKTYPVKALQRAVLYRQ